MSSYKIVASLRAVVVCMVFWHLLISCNLANAVMVVENFKDDAGQSLGSLDDQGALTLSGLLVDACGSNISEDSTINEWILKDSSGILAKVALSGPMKGYMWIKGNVYNSGQSSAHPYAIKNDSGTTVASIDSSGNLYVSSYKTSNSTTQCAAYIDSQCTADKELTDYPDNPDINQIASPKYNFTKTDKIYIKALAPAGLGDRFFHVKVTSNSDSIGMDIYLRDNYDGTYTNVYPNDIYLSNAHETNSIKIIDEEQLSFSFRHGNYASELKKWSVYVDRAEYASGQIRTSSIDPDLLPAKNICDGFNKLNWFTSTQNNSYAYYIDSSDTNSPRDFLLNAGPNVADSLESDFLFFGVHGQTDGSVYFQSGLTPDYILNFSSTPPFAFDNNAHYNNDVEWIYTYACYTLKNGPGLANWSKALLGNPRPAHMILGGWGELVLRDDYQRLIYALIIDKFMELVNTDESIIDSYFEANLQTADHPCAVITHAQNVTDTLRVMQPDNKGRDMKYYWYASGRQSSDYTAAGMTSDNGLGADQEVIEGISVVKSGGLKPISKKTYPLLKMKKSNNLRQGKYRIGRGAYGEDVLNRPMRVTQLKSFQDKESARRISKEAFQEVYGPVPVDAVETEAGTINVLSGNIDSISNTTTGLTLAQVINYDHVMDGIPVDNDHLSIVVAEGEAKIIRFNWHELMEQSAPQEVLDSKSCLKAAVASIKQKRSLADRQEVTLKDTKMVYYAMKDSQGQDTSFIPAWRYSFGMQGDQVGVVFVNALSGEALSQ